CNNIKYLWALPTPTTFEKVDQTFIFGTETFSFAVLCYPTENQLNHKFFNYPNLLKALKAKTVRQKIRRTAKNNEKDYFFVSTLVIPDAASV
ncbi:hypothetical protein, partial [uncultured Ruminococcus sp.]